MSKKVKKKRKINKLNAWAVAISSIAIIGLLCFFAGVIMIATMLSNKPTLNLADFDQTESSIVYDSTGQEIANLGTVIRQNIEFNEIPNSVIDAFVAVEDSRYFEHNGFDVPRFTKAILENIRTLSFGQGGSTFTMQLVKNTYFVNDDTGENAARSGASGVRRKVQEIALALELDRVKSKQEIFESYVNKLNFGGSNNIRGIQKAAQYYFGKDLCDVNLVEGALLAGVINAPNYYNPFYNLEAAQERTTEVLYQMRNHGYITKEEYELAKSVRIEDLLSDPFSSTSEDEGIAYQAYIDQVISEAISITGLDPYTTTMHIYTYMNKGIQNQMDKIQAGEFEDDYLAYPDDYLEVASVCIKNSTGEVVGIMGGRNYAKGGALLLNHATDQYKQPGSTIKPILDYALAFENLGWATDHVITDKPMYLDASNQLLVYNDSGTYVGDVTLKQAVGNSINTCAVQTLQAVLDAKKYEYVVNYCQSLGYDWSLEDFNIQYAYGGATCEVTPYIHAAAYAGLMNYGLYTPPHTIARIEFTNGKSPISPTYESTQVLSEAASYLTTELMYSNVENYGGSYAFVKNDSYPVYGKTGTTDYGTSGAQYGIPSGAIKDGWLIAATSEYTTCTWVGYEKAVTGQPSYITRDFYYNDRPQGKIAHLILDAAYQYGETKPTKLTQPAGVTTISHIIGTWPYAAFSDGMDSSLLTTGLIKSDAVKLVSLPDPKIEDMSDNFEISFDGTRDLLEIEWPKYPDEAKLTEASGVKDISLRNSSGEVVIAATGTCLFDDTKLYGPIRYKADITVSGINNYTEQISSEDRNVDKFLDVAPGDRISVDLYYAFEKGNKTSNKGHFETSAKTTISLPVLGSSQSDLENFCDRYSFVYFNTAKADSQHPDGSFAIVDQNNNPVQPGITVTLDSNTTTFTITYFIQEHYLRIVPSDEGGSVKLKASYAGSSFKKWSYNVDEDDGLSIVENGVELTISINGSVEKSFSFEVSASTDDDKASITIYVNVSEDGSASLSYNQ